jgi:predicted Zn-dependent protease
MFKRGRLRGVFNVLAVCLAATSFVGCKNTNFYSTRDEVRMGRDASKEIEKEYRVDTDSADAKRVQRISERVLAHIDVRPGVPYTVKVLDLKDVNAVSLPGGPLYIFRGLLDLVGDDDDALACVIGHEIGHINGRHAAKQMSQQMAANLGLILLARGGSGGNVAGLVSNMLSLSYSRDDEFESDRRGLSYAFKAGFDPNGLVRFFEKLDALEKRGGPPEFLRTHPVTKARIRVAQQLIETNDYKYGK